MEWYIILSLISLATCLGNCAYHLFKLIKAGAPNDFSESIGDLPAALRYSFTGAMSPSKKESAFLHLPTYTAGIIFHLGTFLSIALFLYFLGQQVLPLAVRPFVAGLLAFSGIAGLGILLKRIVNKELRFLSNPDDYISNVLVTGFQLLSAYYTLQPSIVYFIWASALLLYLPLGKLKHTIYFFAARYHLGFFYGRRGVWPPKN
jgi:hypothetical protein